MALFKRKDGTRNGELVKLVDEKIEEGTDWRILRQVQINRAFYDSKQWIAWDDVRKQVYEPPLRRGEIRYTYNKIKPHILTLLAKLTKNRVQLEVIPDTNDDDRIEIANAAQKYLDYIWKEDDMDGKSMLLKLHMLIDGFAAFKVYVDRYKGEEITLDPTEDNPNPETIRTGKICTIVCDIFSLFIDPSARTEEEIRWVVYRKPRDVEEIKLEYGVEVAPEDNIEIRPLIESWNTDYSKKYKNMAMVNEYWEYPCMKYPNGRKITTAGGQLLDYSEDPGEIPFVFFSMIPVPGRVIGDGVVKDMTTPQRSYNVKRTAEARILEEMGNPIWMVPEAAGVDDEELTNEIGQIVHYTTAAGGKPERVNGVEPGNGWQNAMERDESDMEDISGAHDISQGAAPSGVDTYGGLQLLVEQDETKLSIAVQSYERGIKKWGEKVLRLVKKYFPEEQQIKIVGEDREIEVVSFSGADLTGGEDVDVVQGSSMPESRVAREAKIFQMWSAGMFVNPKTGAPDVRRVTRMLGQSISQAYFGDMEQDENKAKMENKMWEKIFSDPASVELLRQWQESMRQYQQQLAIFAQQGMDMSNVTPPPPMPVKLPVVRDFYDHEIHLEIHNRFRKSDFYDNLPPDLQAIIDQHCSEHEQAIQAPIIAQQQAMQASEQQKAQQEAQEKEREHQRQMERELLKQQAELQKTALKGGVRSAP